MEFTIALHAIQRKVFTTAPRRLDRSKPPLLGRRTRPRSPGFSHNPGKTATILQITTATEPSAPEKIRLAMSVRDSGLRTTQIEGKSPSPVDGMQLHSVKFKQSFDLYAQRPSCTMAADTKEHILDAAEALIADQGIDAVSLRAITSAAKVNLAAVHYHFGCKEALVQKVFERRIRPVNERRLELLDKAERDAGAASVPLEIILRAFIQPAIRLYASDPKGPMFMRVCGRIYAEPSMQIKKSLDDNFTEVVSRFVAPSRPLCPRWNRTSLPGVSTS
ncbi:MAG: TetR/AcrR family transcriptional regulator [Bryobacterales bacterium]